MSGGAFLLAVLAVGALVASLGIHHDDVRAVPAASVVGGNGYWLVASDGGIFSFGDAKFLGSTGDRVLNQPIVGMAANPAGEGYWFVARDGGIFSFGDAKFFGSTGDRILNQPIVGMAATPTGNGYWLVASDGGIFAFGDAKFLGGTGDRALNQPIVGMAATPTGNGYWFVARDGGIFAFGDAKFFGSAGAVKLNKPIVGMTATPDGAGYWLVASDGGIFSYGKAEFLGSTGDRQLSQPIVGMASSPTGKGYRFVASDGGIFAFGDAGFHGSAGDQRLTKPVVGMAATPRRVVNATPLPAADSASLDEDGTVDIDVLANDGGLDDGGIKVTLADGAAHGTASVVGNQVRYVPAANYFGNDVVTYRVTDADGDAATAKVSLTVRSINDAPTLAVTGGLADGAVTGESRPTITGTAGDIDGTIAKVEVSVDDAAFSNAGVTGTSSWEWTPAAGLGDGAHTAKFHSVDNQAGTSTSTTRSFVVDRTPPSVTVNQASGQADPETAANTVAFTAVFSEAVTGFTPSDVTVAGTGGGARTVAVTGSGTTYTVSVTGLTDGTVVVTIPAGVAADASGNTNGASTSTDNTVNVDRSAPSVTINQAVNQPDPTNATPVTFTAEFSEPVTGFDNLDVTITGTAFGLGALKSASVSGGPAIYTVSVSGMNQEGTIVASIPAAAAKDNATHDSTASTSTDNTVSRDTTGPDVTVKQAVSQPDPTTGEPVAFTVTFTETVTGFTASDVTFSGTASGARDVVVTGSGTTYNISVTNITDGTLIADVVTGAATDTAGNASKARSGSDDRTVSVGHTPPNVLSVLQDSGQEDPTNENSAGDGVDYVVSFSEPVTLDMTKITAVGTAFASATPTITPTPAANTPSTSFALDVRGMDAQGTVTLALAAGAAKDAGNNPTADFDEGSAGDRTVTYDSVKPGVAVAVDVTQASPSSENSAGDGLDFTVTFSEPVSGFTSSDVTIVRDLGSAFGPLDTPTITVSGPGPVYNVDVSGMPKEGTVTVHLGADVANDVAGNTSNAAPADATVTYSTTALTVTIDQHSSQQDVTTADSAKFTAAFSSSVSDFTAADVATGGTGGGARTVTVTGSGSNYTITVSGLTEGTLTVSIPAGGAHDGVGTGNSASTVAAAGDDTVKVDRTAPTVAVTKASGQEDPTDENAAGDGVDFTVTFSEPVTGFTNADVTVGGTGFTGGDTKTVVVTDAGAHSVYNVDVRGMSTNGTVTVSIPAGGATDGANTNAASPSPGSVAYDQTVPSYVKLVVEDGSPVVEAWFSEPLACSSVTTTDFAATAGLLPAVVTAVNGCSTTDGQVTLTLSLPVGPAGAHVTLLNTVTDVAGNTTAAPPSMTDHTAQPPAVTVAPTSPADNAFDNDNNVGVYSGTATDADGTIARVEVKLDGVVVLADACAAAGCATGWTYTPPPLAVGAHTVSVQAFDDGRSRSAAAVRTVTVDQTPPAFTSVAAGSNPFQVTATFSEPIACNSVSDTDFTATVGGLPAVVTNASCAGASSSTITLTLAAPVTGGQTVAITLVSPVKDRAGNDSATGITRSYVAS